MGCRAQHAVDESRPAWQKCTPLQGHAAVPEPTGQQGPWCCASVHADLAMYSSCTAAAMWEAISANCRAREEMTMMAHVSHSAGTCRRPMHGTPAAGRCNPQAPQPCMLGGMHTATAHLQRLGGICGHRPRGRHRKLLQLPHPLGHPHRDFGQLLAVVVPGAALQAGRSTLGQETQQAQAGASASAGLCSKGKHRESRRNSDNPRWPAC